MKKYFVLIAGDSASFYSLENMLNNSWEIERVDNIKKELE